MLDGGTVRFALLATAPFLFCVSLFFSLQVRARALSSCSFYIFFGLILCTQVITNISYVLGPVAQFHENSRFYSAVAPKPNPEVDNRLPHITIQMPVYKESLKETMCVFFPFLSFLSFLSWGYSCYQCGFGRAPASLAFMLTTAGISAPEGICAGSPFRLWAWAATSRLRRYSGPGTRLGLIETRCFDADLLPVALDGMQMRDGDGD